MNIAKTLALLFAPAAFVDAQVCTVDFPRPWDAVSTPVANPWPPAAPQNLPAWLMGLNGTMYGLWGAFVGSLLRCPDLNSTLVPAEIADVAGDAIVCFYDNSANCPSYRTTVTNCSSLPFPLPGEFCFRIPECTDLFTNVGGLGAISAKWNAGTGASRKIDVHAGYGCTGTPFLAGTAASEGVCQKFPNQQFYIKAWNGEGRGYQPYAANWAQTTAHAAICNGAYNQTCLGTTNQGVAFASAFAAAVAADSCPDLSDYPETPFPAGSGSDSDSDSTGSGTSSASTIVASVALIGVGAFLF